MTSHPRGAKPSPRHRLLAAAPHKVVAAPPSQFAVVPKQLSMWGNQTYGDCVTAEEAFAKAWWAVFCGLPELFVPEATVIAWARQYGFLNGATLIDVLDAMEVHGFSVGGTVYTNGSPSGVNYADETVLQSALTTGPVKIAIDADALPSGAGNQMGWYATQGGRFPNTDHCVAILAYGPAGWLYQQMGVPLPTGLPADTRGYLVFTWDTIGFVTHAWLMGTCVEAWVRTPTTVQQSPTPNPNPPVPPVPPTPPSPPVPPVPPPPVPMTGTGTVAPVQITVPGFLGRPTVVTVPGQTIQVTMNSGVAQAIHWPGFVTFETDVMAIVSAYRDNSITSLEAAVKQLATDFGLTL